MKSTCTIRRGQAAYTMVELMVAVLISIILMVAMYQIFARTQKIFTEGHHRGKMYEEGRALMDLIVRDLEQIAPSGEKKQEWYHLPLPPAKRMKYLRGFYEEWGFNLPIVYHSDPILRDEPDDNGYHPFYGCNFMAWPYDSNDLNATERPDMDLHPLDYKDWRPETQQGWDAAITETLISSRVEFFVQDDGWRVMGYRLYSQNDPTFQNKKIIGTLWRYESSRGTVDALMGKTLALRENGDSLYQKLSENVIHFRMRAVSRKDPGRALWGEPRFDGKDVPLYVEVELGIIEERLKEEILNDAEVERYDVKLEPRIDPVTGELDATPSNTYVLEKRNKRVRELLVKNTDRILMLRQVVSIPSASGN
jgi:hypothetical protein